MENWEIYRSKNDAVAANHEKANKQLAEELPRDVLEAHWWDEYEMVRDSEGEMTGRKSANYVLSGTAVQDLDGGNGSSAKK